MTEIAFPLHFFGSNFQQAEVNSSSTGKVMSENYVKMKTIILILFVSTMPCFAHIGETEVQCIARYGKPVDGSRVEYDASSKQMDFIKGVFKIEVGFMKDHACVVQYNKIDGSMITDEELADLLKANGGAAVWHKVIDDTPQIFLDWESDTGLQGTYSNTQKWFSINNSDFKVFEKTQAAYQASQSTKGL